MHTKPLFYDIKKHDHYVLYRHTFIITTQITLDSNGNSNFLNKNNITITPFTVFIEVKGNFHPTRKKKTNKILVIHMRLQCTMSVFFLFVCVVVALFCSVHACMSPIHPIISFRCSLIRTDMMFDLIERFYGPITSRLDLLCASGFFAIIAAITFLVDAILLVRAGNRGEFEY